MESNNRTSFFDDDDLTITFQFQKPSKMSQKDLIVVPVIKTSLYSVVTHNKAAQAGYYALHNKALAYYKVLF